MAARRGSARVRCAATLVLFPPDIIAVVIGHTKRVEEDKSTAARIVAIVG